MRQELRDRLDNDLPDEVCEAIRAAIAAEYEDWLFNVRHLFVASSIPWDGSGHLVEDWETGCHERMELYSTLEDWAHGEYCGRSEATFCSGMGLRYWSYKEALDETIGEIILDYLLDGVEDDDEREEVLTDYYDNHFSYHGEWFSEDCMESLSEAALDEFQGIDRMVEVEQMFRQVEEGITPSATHDWLTEGF